MGKLKYIKLFEEFDRPEEIAGLKLIGEMSTKDFMDKMQNHQLGLEHENCVYRLVNYEPNSNLSWHISGSQAKPLKNDKNAVVQTSDRTYRSPFVIYPNIVKMMEGFFYHEEGMPADVYVRYKGNSKKKMDTMFKKYICTFSGLSISAFIGNRDEAENNDSSLIYKLSVLLEDVFDNKKRHDSWIKSTRNYIGYNFDKVLIYNIEDPDEAAESILKECRETKTTY